MPSNYPASLDDFTNPTVSDYLNSTTVPHATQHSDLNDAVENLQAKVGIDSSADTDSLDYKVTDHETRISTVEAGATATAVIAYADLSARTAGNPSPSEGDVSWQEDTNRFDIYNGSAWVEVAGGKILQVVSTTKTDTFSTTSTSYVDLTGLAATITPTSSSSNIFVMFNVGISTSTANTIELVLDRSGTDICVSSTGATAMTFPDDQFDFEDVSSRFLDSPATTSAVTYKVQMKVATGTGYVNRRGANASFISTSTITVMEVSA